MDRLTLLKLESNAQTLLHEIRMSLDGLDATSSICDESIQALAARIQELAQLPDYWERIESGSMQGR